MAETASSTAVETRRRGRPRDPSRDRAILTAAREVMARRGFTGATMEEIASVAGVGKDTLYRRWASKDQLAIDLVELLAREAVAPVPLDPDPRFNLFTFLKDIVRFNRTTDFGPLIAGIVGEAARNPDLAHSFQTFWRHRRALAAELVTDVIGPGASPDALDSTLDQLLAPIYYRLLLSGDDITDEYLWGLVASVPWSTEPQ